MNGKIKIAYVEDHRIVREGVTYLLSQYPNFEIVTKELEPDHVKEFISQEDLDILIIDLQLYAGKDGKQLNGFELCEIVAANYPRVKIIAHSMYDNVESVNKFFNKGGMAFVSKKSGHADLVEAIKHVADNKRFVCSEIVKKSKNALNFVNREEEQLKAVNDLFTKTEKSVLEKIAKGFSTKQIAQQLEISEKTVETHRKHLFDKTNVKNVAELIAFAYINKLIID
jgi:DNA-binding NarL/FixJ family response regulator